MTRPRSRLRRVERRLVGVVMAALVFVLERLVIRQIEKKERAALETSQSAVTVGKG
ncbi:MAG TPA: hypothetical protein VFQ40_01140 [Actinomycetota bacterium]|nr:hypothetical protein [Actinomycetota bacterium]